MMRNNLILFAIILIFWACSTKGECPNINSIPVMNEDSTNFVCAQTWDAPGSVSPIEGCNTISASYILYKGQDLDATDCCLINMGSVIVKAGCTLYGWEHGGYTGRLFEYQGPNVFPNGCTNPYDPTTCPPALGVPPFANGPVSIKCRCQQEPIICVPEDGWERIMQCDNSEGSTATTCKYKKTIGTTYSSEVQNSMSIDVSIEEAMEASYFTLLSETLGISASTGYDWTRTSSETKSEEHSYEVDTDVPPGTIVMIDGAIGRCGGSTSKTELFKISSYDTEGRLLEEKYEDRF